MIVTPWEVKGKIDYGKLIREFGVKPIDDVLHNKIVEMTKEDHHYLRRGIFFAHMYADLFLEEIKQGKKGYLYTGRAPSGPVHLGHLVPWIFTKWLQDKFNLPLLFQIPDEEKFLFKRDLSLEDAQKWAYENILDIIAVGFDPKKTFIFKDTEEAGKLYRIAVRVAKRITVSTAKATFGLNDSSNIGQYFYTAMQSAPAFLPTEIEGEPTRVLIPCAIDQDVHFRLTRDVAEKLNYPKPATILSRFLPGLKGMEDGKMSSSDPTTAIYTTDAPEEVKRKIFKYAFSGGGNSIEEHRKYGGNPDIDIPYQWLTFFEESDSKLKKIYDDYRSGSLLSGEIKQILIDKINSFLKEHQKRREWAKDHIDEFMGLPEF